MSGWRDSRLGQGYRRLANLLRRDPPLVAAGKIWRYLRWRVPSEIGRWQLGRLTSSEDRFTRIYRSNFWAAKESVSGPGSSLDNTRHLRRQLPVVFESFAIKSVFDAPCGDFNWMKTVVAQCDVDYVGADIVRPMIERNVAQYGSARVAFRHLDITKEASPRADLWICRDCFYHLSIDDVSGALRRFVESNIPYLLASTYKDIGKNSARDGAGSMNRDIFSGDFRPTDLFAAPFSLPGEVLFRIDDNLLSDMCLWSRDQVIASLSRGR